jgi:tetratricopeptide (TPR) repeat protein
MSSRSKFSEYIRAFLISGLAALGFVLLITLFAQVRAYFIVQSQDTPEVNVNSSVVKYLIEKNNYLAIQHPKDYKINVKLGLLYEYCKEFKESEHQYRLAIDKSDFNDYGPYQYLALLYIKMDRLDDAADLIDNIDERPYKPLVKMKGYTYALIGNAYYLKGKYEDAIEFYQKSLMYYKIIKAKEEKTVIDSMASAYVYASEDYISYLDRDNAIEALKEADSLENSAVVKYKLALLLMDVQPKDAYSYFQKVFEIEPSIINYNIYYKFIMTMAANAEADGNQALADLYRYRAEKYKEYYENNILSTDDLNIQYIKSKITYNIFSRKYKIGLEMKLRNTSERPLKSVYAIVQFKNEDGTPICNYIMPVVDKKSILAPSELTPVISLHVHKRKGLLDKHPKRVIVEIYFAVSPNSYKLHLETIRVSEDRNAKPSKMNQFQKSVAGIEELKKLK